MTGPSAHNCHINTPDDGLSRCTQTDMFLTVPEGPKWQALVLLLTTGTCLAAAASNREAQCKVISCWGTCQAAASCSSAASVSGSGMEAGPSLLRPVSAGTKLETTCTHTANSSCQVKVPLEHFVRTKHVLIILSACICA